MKRQLKGFLLGMFIFFVSPVSAFALKIPSFVEPPPVVTPCEPSLGLKVIVYGFGTIVIVGFIAITLWLLSSKYATFGRPAKWMFYCLISLIILYIPIAYFSNHYVTDEMPHVCSSFTLDKGFE